MIRLSCVGFELSEERFLNRCICLNVYTFRNKNSIVFIWMNHFCFIRLIASLSVICKVRREKEKKKLFVHSARVFLFHSLSIYLITKQQSSCYQCLLTVHLQAKVPKKKNYYQILNDCASICFFFLYEWSISLFYSKRKHENIVRCLNSYSFILFFLYYRTCQN